MTGALTMDRRQIREDENWLCYTDGWYVDNVDHVTRMLFEEQFLECEANIIYWLPLEINARQDE